MLLRSLATVIGSCGWTKEVVLTISYPLPSYTRHGVEIYYCWCIRARGSTIEFETRGKEDWRRGKKKGERERVKEKLGDMTPGH